MLNPASNIAILAGNGRLEIHDGQVRYKLQLEAFREGLLAAQAIHTETGLAPQLFTALDHRESFKGFLADRFRKKAHGLNLSHMISDITNEYAAVAGPLGFDLADIGVIREGAARSHAEQEIAKGTYKRISGHMCVRNSDGESLNDLVLQPKVRIKCGGIAFEYLARATRHADKVHVFVEEDAWCQHHHYTQGIMLLNNVHAKGATLKFLMNKDKGPALSLRGASTPIT